MTKDEAGLPLSRDELVALVLSLRRQVKQQAVVIEALRKEIEDLRRGGKRQAAPFSRGIRKTDPKRPGRKSGEGTFSYRQAPLPEEITEPLVEVPVTNATCSACGGRLQHERVDVASVADIPPMPRPQVTAYRVQVSRCVSCDKSFG